MNTGHSQKQARPLFALAATGFLVLASCASNAPIADTNRDGFLSDSEMTQFRRQQEVRGNRPQQSAVNKGIRGVRAAREVAGTANTFYWLTRWL